MLPWMFFGTTSQFTRVVKFVREHPGLNCFVVDVKDNNGRIPQVPGGEISRYRLSLQATSIFRVGQCTHAGRLLHDRKDRSVSRPIYGKGSS